MSEPSGPPKRLKSVRVEDRARNLFVAEYGRLAAWAGAAVDDATTGHDIAAEAFTRLWGRFRTVRDPRAYLYVTAANLIRDDWRGRRRRGALVETLGLQLTLDVSAPDLTLRDLIDRLPVKQRLVILLHYYADHSVAGVAQILQMPAGSVKRELHDARKTLGVALEDQSG